MALSDEDSRPPVFAQPMNRASLLLAFWISAPLLCPAQTTPPPRKVWEFQDAGVVFDTRFDCSRLNECSALAPGEYQIVIQPENMPVNPSPWFAFKVGATARRDIVLHLRCQAGPWRYVPKISTDGVRWITVTGEAFQRKAEKGHAVLKLEVGPEPLWVAAQELVSVEAMEAWMRTLERLPFVTRRAFGESALGHPLHRLDIGRAKRHVVIIGRQHPPETTGSLALMKFVETLCGDSPLARDFRREFHVALMPLLNPDGVALGHWRHSTGGGDLNRDWGKFSQPETRLARDQILALRQDGRVFLFLDFHSTFRDVFYTQSDQAVTSPAGFTGPWVQAIQSRFPGHTMNRSDAPMSTPGVSIVWAHRTLGIPAIVYELGDETDRSLLAQIAAFASEQMMRQLLALKDAP